MKIIKRFDLAIEPTQTIDVPFNDEFMGLTVFNDKPGLLFLVDPHQKVMRRTFVMVAEGKELSERANKTNHRGCFEHKAEVGSHVLHVFEE